MRSRCPIPTYILKDSCSDGHPRIAVQSRANTTSDGEDLSIGAHTWTLESSRQRSSNISLEGEHRPSRQTAASNGIPQRHCDVAAFVAAKSGQGLPYGPRRRPARHEQCPAVLGTRARSPKPSARSYDNIGITRFSRGAGIVWLCQLFEFSG